MLHRILFRALLTLSVLGKLKNLIFEAPLIPQSSKINY